MQMPRLTIAPESWARDYVGTRFASRRRYPQRAIAGCEVRLRDVRLFAVGGVGITGSPNRGETITRELAHRRDAIEAFSWLAEHGEPAAQLYAYWALRTLAPARAATYAPVLAKVSTVVETMTGCLAWAERVSSLAARMANPDDVVGQPMPAP